MFLRHCSQQKFFICTIKRHLQRFKFIPSWYFSPLLPFTSLFPIDLCKECVLAILFLYWFFAQCVSSLYIDWIFHTIVNLVHFTNYIAVLIYQVINGTTGKLNNLMLCLKEPMLSGPWGMMEDPSVKHKQDDAAGSKSQILSCLQIDCCK